MFTQRAALLGVVALCFYLVATVNSLPNFYYVLVWLAVGLLAASLGIALLSLAGTTCSLRMRREFGYGDWPVETRDQDLGGAPTNDFGTGNEAPALWEADLGNTGTLNKTGLLLDLRLRRDEASGAAGKGKSLIGTRFLIEALPSGARFTAPLALGFLPRGRYSLESTRIVGSDVLGLFRLARRLSGPDVPLEVVVGPPLISLPALHDLSRGAGGQEGQRARKRLGAGGDLRGVRPYVVGDDWRHIHWATTARTGNLAVREFEHTGHSTVLVVWDGASGSNWGEGAVSTLEDGLALCQSLLVAVDATQTPLALAVLGDTSAWSQGEIEGGLLPRAMIASLTDARPERQTPLTQALLHAANVEASAFGQVFFVSSSLRHDLVEAVIECVSRGNPVSVALLDGAIYAASSPENRRLIPRGRAIPTQSDGETLVPVSAASFDAQEENLRRAGARVVRVAPELQAGARGARSRRQTLEAALASLLEN